MAQVYYMDEIKDHCKRYMDKDEKRLDELIYYLVKSCYKGGMLPEDIFPTVKEISNLCDPLMIDQETIDKFDRCIEECKKESGDTSIAQEVYDFVMSTSGYFWTTDVYNSLQLATRKDKKTANQALSRLVKRNIIERTGKRNGQFRRIDRELEIIDPKKDLGKEIDIILPLGLNEVVKVFPKNLIVFAGVSNTGKTALALNIVGLNMDRFNGRINYFSSEMGACELKTRLNGFGLPLDAWDGCRFGEKSGNFEDVIEPDNINIIDYYEVCSDFSEIAESFRKVYAKLNKGIAIITIQKTKGVEYGRGGSFSTEKPRLYVTLDESTYNPDIIIAKIVKAKNWKTSKNPNKIWKKFKIRDGCKIDELSVWLEPEREDKKKGY